MEIVVCNIFVFGQGIIIPLRNVILNFLTVNAIF